MRWRLGWHPGGTSRPCPFYPSQTLANSHSTHCLNMHRQLQSPATISDHLSFLLNELPNWILHPFQAALSWFLWWPTICTTLLESDYLCREKFRPLLPPYLGQILLGWFPTFSRWCLLYFLLFPSTPKTFILGPIKRICFSFRSFLDLTRAKTMKIKSLYAHLGFKFICK